MIVIEEAGVELDWCPSCRGIWFDSGEIEILLGKVLTGDFIQDISSAFTKAIDVEKKRRLPCPSCGKKMKKVVCGEGEEKIVIDVCSIGDGLWFDCGETFGVMKKIAAGREADFSKLAGFLEVFEGSSPKKEAT